MLEGVKEGNQSIGKLSDVKVEAIPSLTTSRRVNRGGQTIYGTYGTCVLGRVRFGITSRTLYRASHRWI